MLRYHKGTEVAHVDNIELKMRVRQVVYSDNKLKHITCSFYQEGKYIEADFHSHELVPFEIAEKGKEYVDSYILSIANRKKFKDYENEFKQHSSTD